MTRHLLVLALMSTVVAGVAGSATAGPPATSSVGVEVQSDDLTGLRPNGTTVVFQAKVVAEGEDASSLVGDGRHFGSGGAHNYWPATGSIDGNVVTLAGVVADSNAAFLIGSPVEIQADSSSGAMTLTFGPLAGGPFAGATIVADGAGRVKIRMS
jgi:hypothetical protein